MPGLAARADRRLTRIASAILLGLLVLLPAACGRSSATAPSPARSSGSSTDGTAGAQASLNGLATAALRHDRAAFDTHISTRDPGFASTADRMFTGLSGAPLTSLSFAVRPDQQDLTAARQAVLGPRAQVRQVTVRWQVTGDGGPAEQLVWMTFLTDDSDRIAGTTDGPPERRAEPLWLVDRVTGRQSGHTTVLAASLDAGASAGPSSSAAVWIKRGNASAVAVAARLGPQLAQGWNGDLVIELPSSRQAFEQVLGVTPGSYTQIAAVAWPDGPDAATAAIRVVVNPEQATRLDEQAADVLLTHEATHVATRSAASPAPTWLVEGLADYIAYDAYPRSASAAEAGLLEQVKRSGAPTAFPASDRFSPTAPDLALSYAAAWTACRFLADSFSPVGLSRFYLEVNSGSSVDQAATAVFGRTEAQLVSAWRRDLAAAAGRT